MPDSQDIYVTGALANDAHTTANQKLSERIAVSDCHDSNIESSDGLGQPQPTSLLHSSLGIPGRKTFLSTTEILAVLVTILCLAAAGSVVSPSLGIAWKLGRTRQLQVIGFLLSIMNQCFRVASPKLFLAIEATIGPSVLQNYDAILRNSALISHTSWMWRTTLLLFIALPLGLSVAYKDFQQGHASRSSKNTGNHYGMTGPAGVEYSDRSIGIPLMVNATLPFIAGTVNDSTTLNDTAMPAMPIAFGFNGLLLSDKSAAFVDGPMPDYVSKLQQSLDIDESYELSATVHATLTTYNETIEIYREEDKYWNYYNVSNIESIWLYKNNYNLGVLYNTQITLYDNQTIFAKYAANQSWIFVGLFQNNANPNDLGDFKMTAMQFSTRRELCDAQWMITFDSIKIINGSCHYPPLPNISQNMFTRANLALETYYLPPLAEFLEPFAFSRKQSPWLMPTFTTVVAGMYWARVTSVEGYQSWGMNKTLYANPDLASPQRADFYYPLNDTIVAFRPAMNPSWILYAILICQPLLTIVAVLACLAMRHAPVDDGFGMTAVLAGARVETLRLLEGASFTGKLKEPLRMGIVVHDTGSTGETEQLRNEYVFGSEERNQSLSRQARVRRTPSGFAKGREMFRSNRPWGTQYEMI